MKHFHGEAILIFVCLGCSSANTEPDDLGNAEDSPPSSTELDGAVDSSTGQPGIATQEGTESKPTDAGTIADVNGVPSKQNDGNIGGGNILNGDASAAEETDGNIGNDTDAGMGDGGQEIADGFVNEPDIITCPDMIDCTAVECGPDPFCGSNCGTCGPDSECRAGRCSCVPDCEEKTCGEPDGCGGACVAACIGELDWRRVSQDWRLDEFSSQEYPIVNIVDSALGYDPARRAMVLVFGYSPALPNSGHVSRKGDHLVTWESADGNWLPRNTSFSPPNFSGFRIVEDPGTGLLLMPGPNGSVWEWDGLDWRINSCPEGTPGFEEWPVHSYAAVFSNIDDNEVITHGGLIDGPGGIEGVASVMAVWSADARSCWQIREGDSGNPGLGRRFGHVGVSDDGLNQLLFFGGASGQVDVGSSAASSEAMIKLVDQNLLGDTWTQVGTHWERVVTSSPLGRRAFSASAKGSGGVAYIYGGVAAPGACDNDVIQRCNDTWKWNGTDWVQVTTSHAPPIELVGLSMAFDPARGWLVLVGSSQEDDNRWALQTWVLAPSDHAMLQVQPAATPTKSPE